MKSDSWKHSELDDFADNFRAFKHDTNYKTAINTVTNTSLMSRHRESVPLRNNIGNELNDVLDNIGFDE